MTTGLIYDPRFLQHDVGEAALMIPPGGLIEPGPHVAGPDALRRTRSLLDASGLASRLAPIEPYLATTEDLAAYHTRRYIDEVRRTCQAGGGVVAFHDLRLVTSHAAEEEQ